MSELMMAPRSQNSTFSQQKSTAFYYTAYLQDKKCRSNRCTVTNHKTQFSLHAAYETGM